MRCVCVYMGGYVCSEEELGPSDSNCLRLSPLMEDFWQARSKGWDKHVLRWAPQFASSEEGQVLKRIWNLAVSPGASQALG